MACLPNRGRASLAGDYGGGSAAEAMLSQAYQEYADLVEERHMLTSEFETQAGEHFGTMQILQQIIEGNDDLIRLIEDAVGPSKQHAFSDVIGQARCTKFTAQHSIDQIGEILAGVSACSKDAPDICVDEAALATAVLRRPGSPHMSFPSRSFEEVRSAPDVSTFPHSFEAARSGPSAALGTHASRENCAPEVGSLAPGSYLTASDMALVDQLAENLNDAQASLVLKVYNETLQSMKEKSMLRSMLTEQLDDIQSSAAMLRGLAHENGQIIRQIDDVAGTRWAHLCSQMTEEAREKGSSAQQHVENINDVVAFMRSLLEAGSGDWMEELLMAVSEAPMLEEGSGSTGNTGGFGDWPNSQVTQDLSSAMPTSAGNPTMDQSIGMPSPSSYPSSNGHPRIVNHGDRTRRSDRRVLSFHDELRANELIQSQHRAQETMEAIASAREQDLRQFNFSADSVIAREHETLLAYEAAVAMHAAISSFPIQDFGEAAPSDRAHAALWQARPAVPALQAPPDFGPQSDAPLLAAAQALPMGKQKLYQAAAAA